MLRAAILTIALCTDTVAQDGPDLTSVVSDDFSTDTRTDYSTEGDVGWEAGRLRLAEGASIRRAVDGGAWISVQLDFDFPILAANETRRETRLMVILNEATPCQLAFIRSRGPDGVETSVSLADHAPVPRQPDGSDQASNTRPRTQAVVVRRANVVIPEKASIHVSYRHGLVQVSVDDVRLLLAHIDNSDAAVRAIQFKATHAVCRLQELSVAAVPASAPLSAAQREQLDEQTALGREMLSLHRKGQPAKAAEVAKRVVALVRGVYGDRHPEYARCLNNLAFLHSASGAFANAGPLYEESLEIKADILGELHPDYAAGLNNLAEFYRTTSDYERALPLCNRALEIRGLVFGERHPTYATSLNNLSLVLSRVGRKEEALAACQRALRIREATLGQDHPSYITSLSNFGAILIGLGRYVQAEEALRQVAQDRRRKLGESHPTYAVALNNLGSVHQSMGEYAQAEDLYEQAGRIWEASLGAEHPNHATALGNLATVCRTRGKYDKAESLLRRSLELKRTKFGNDHPACAVGLNNLALLYADIGDYVKAEKLGEEALAIRRLTLGADHPTCATSLVNLALLAQKTGDLTKAESLLLEAVAIRKSHQQQQRPAYTSALGGLASVYEGMGRLEQARALLEEVVEADRRALGDQHPDYASSVNNLGSLYQDLGQLHRAEQRYRAAGEIWRKTLGEHHPDYAHSLNNLATVNRVRGRLKEAAALLEQAGTIWLDVYGAQHPLYALSLLNRAAIAAQAGNPRKADELVRQAAGIASTNLERDSVVQSERQQKVAQADHRSYLDWRLAFGLANRTPPQDLLETLWRWKGAVTLRQRGYRRIAAEPELAPIFASLQAVTRDLSAMSARAPVPPPATASRASRVAYEEQRDRWHAQFESLNQQREELEEKIASESEDSSRLQSPLTVASLRSRLPAGAALVDFIEYWHPSTRPDGAGKGTQTRRLLAFVVRTDREPAVIPLGEASVLQAAIEDFRRGFTDDGGDAAGDAAARLREKLWLPVEQHLSGVHTVVVSPDGALGSLAFAALPGSRPRSFLLEDYRFVSEPLVRLLQTTRPTAVGPERGLLLVGDVNYDADGGEADPNSPATEVALRRRSPPGGQRTKWRSLPGFEQELTLVQSRFEQTFGATATTLDGSSATEEQFIKRLPGHASLHLVTHAFFADPQFESVEGPELTTADTLQDRLARNEQVRRFLPGLLSGIVLAGANNPPPAADPRADGILTASEIETLDLHQLDLVVLSACETGLGAASGGEGLTGLQRAFRIAGAGTVVASLWKVDDQATLELMKQFYTNLWVKKQSRIDALRNAQLWMLNNPDTLAKLGVKHPRTRGDVRDLKPAAPGQARVGRTSPYFWAAFTLSGNWW